jgi:hypothetical protein
MCFFPDPPCLRTYLADPSKQTINVFSLKRTYFMDGPLGKWVKFIFNWSHALILVHNLTSRMQPSSTVIYRLCTKHTNSLQFSVHVSMLAWVGRFPPIRWLHSVDSHSGVLKRLDGWMKWMQQLYYIKIVVMICIGQTYLQAFDNQFSLVIINTIDTMIYVSRHVLENEKRQ